MLAVHRFGICASRSISPSRAASATDLYVFGGSLPARSTSPLLMVGDHLHLSIIDVVLCFRIHMYHR